ncbi:hypothetical protein G9A89_016744 [Geosiphon pyriformis]|nr:hypothetical protein G9A89_016744 [Geosiphon pyriformis]
MKSLLSSFFIVISSLISNLYLIQYCDALDNGLGRVPSMGWNSWNKFACDINEKLIRETADALVSTGLRDLGYKYLNLDDCWQKSRTFRGDIVPDKNKFPSGMKALADYIHERGLLFGVYSSAGFWTCQRRPGSLWREDNDAQQYAEWDVDYLKYDNCYNLSIESETRYTWMRDALNKTDRPIIYSICNWGEEDSWVWGPKVANSWRTTGDINDVYQVDKKQDPRKCDPCGMLEILDATVGIEDYSSPGGFNDLDMLEVGNGGMTHEEYKTHFSLWAALKSPLLIGCDVRNLTAQTKEILTNNEIIAVNQDPLGKSAKLVLRKEGNYDIWAGKLSDDEDGLQQSVAVLFNRKDTPQSITLPFALLAPFFGKPKTDEKHNALIILDIRDLWLKKDLGIRIEEITTDEIPPHGVVVLKTTLVMWENYEKDRWSKTHGNIAKNKKELLLHSSRFSRNRHHRVKGVIME